MKEGLAGEASASARIAINDEVRLNRGDGCGSSIEGFVLIAMEFREIELRIADPKRDRKCARLRA